MKKRNIVNYGSRTGQRDLHPKIRVEGKYLARFGFGIGDSIETTVEENRIVIRKISKEDILEPLATNSNQTTNTMEPNEKEAKPVSTLFLIEKGTWRKGEEVITITTRPEGQRHRAVAHIFAEYDAKGNVSFLTKDRAGNEILPPTPNRFELKKQLLANEQQLIERLNQEQGKTQSAQEQTAAPTTAQPAPAATQTPEQQVKKPRAPRKSNRKEELAQTRNAQTGPENEQTQTQ